MLETIKQIAELSNPIFVGGVASVFNGYRKDWSEVKDIDIVTPILTGITDVEIKHVNTMFDKSKKRGITNINGYMIDIFFTTMKQHHINTIEIDGVTIRYINKLGQKEYYSKVIHKSPSQIKERLLMKYKNELNYI